MSSEVALGSALSALTRSTQSRACTPVQTPHPGADPAPRCRPRTPVQTPHMRSVKAQASRGSRPFRMISRPRHILPVETALRITLFASRFTSMRR